MTKYFSLKHIVLKLGLDGQEAKQKELVALFSDPDFANGRVPLSRAGDVFLEYQTVYDAAHSGPEGFPADALYEEFAHLHTIDEADLPTEAPARTARTPRTPAASPADAAETTSAIGAVLRGLPEAEDGSDTPLPSRSPTIERTPDAPVETPKATEKPTRSRRRSDTKAEEKANTAAAHADAAGADTAPEAGDFEPQSAVDLVMERAKRMAGELTGEEVTTYLQARRAALAHELAIITKLLSLA